MVYQIVSENEMYSDGYTVLSFLSKNVFSLVLIVLIYH